MKKKLIQFKNIVKSYEDGKVVLKGIDLDIYENEFVTLLGPSGCGKTTLINLFMRFYEYHIGVFDGIETVRHDERCSAAHKLGKCLLYLYLGARIDRRCSLIEYEHRR